MGPPGKPPHIMSAAKSHQSCPTLCNPIDGSPPGSPVPGIFQARILEWAAIFFSNSWKWKVKVKSLSHARLLVTSWTAAYQAPLSMGFSRQEYWSGCHCLLRVCLLETMKGRLGAYWSSLILIVITVMIKTKHLRHIDNVSVLPGKFHEQRSLVGYSPWGHKESDMTEWTHTHTHTHTQSLSTRLSSGNQQGDEEVTFGRVFLQILGICTRETKFSDFNLRASK